MSDDEKYLEDVLVDYMNQPLEYPYTDVISSKPNKFSQLDRYKMEFKVYKNSKIDFYKLSSNTTYISKTNEINMIDIIEKSKTNDFKNTFINKDKLNIFYFEDSCIVERKTQVGFQLLKNFYKLGKDFVR